MDQCHLITLIFQRDCGRRKRVATGRTSQENRRVDKGIKVKFFLENHLKKENKMYKENNKNPNRENEQLTKNISKLQTKNTLISKQAFRWLNEKKTWKYKYERHKVNDTIYK